MRFDTGTIRRGLNGTSISTAPAAPADPKSQPEPIAYRITEANPYRHWLILLCVGAAFACASSLIDATWMFGILAQRVRGFPSRYILRNAYPFLTLATAALTWVAAWLLTSDEPSLEAQGRFRANLLRLLVTVSFLASSAYVLRLLEPFGAVAWSGPFSWLLQSVDILIVLLLWPHLLHVAARLELRGVRWRAAIAMVGLLFSSVLATVPPEVILRQMRLGPDVYRHFVNFRLAMQILWSTLAALVLLRFAMVFAKEVREETQNPEHPNI
jgi:hypothetical protein